MANDIGGVWRTIGGRRVFIKDGQNLMNAMKESGKFKSAKKSKDKKDHTFDMNDEDKEKYEKVGKKIDDLTEKINNKDREVVDYYLKKGEFEKADKYMKEYGLEDEREYFIEGLNKGAQKDYKEYQKKNSEIYFMDQELGVERPIPSREEWEKEWNSRGDREDYADTSYESLIDSLEADGTINREQAKQYLEGNHISNSKVENNNKNPYSNINEQKLISKIDKYTEKNSKYNEFKVDGDIGIDIPIQYVSQGYGHFYNASDYIERLRIGKVIEENEYNYLKDILWGENPGNDKIREEYLSFKRKNPKTRISFMGFKDYYIKNEKNTSSMNDSIREAYNDYKKKHPNSKMTFTTFKDNNK